MLQNAASQFATKMVRATLFRRTTPGALRLLRSSDIGLWNAFESRYMEALRKACKKESDFEKLARCDHWLRNDLPKIVDARRGRRHVVKCELERVLQWQTWRRGKMFKRRTFIAYKQNSGKSVIKLTKEAFLYAKDGNYSDALMRFYSLRGVSPTAATAILSILYPDKLVFMDDEILEAATGKLRRYEVSIFDEVQKVISSKALELGPDWNMEKVGRVMWTAGMLTSPSDIIISAQSDQLRLAVEEEDETDTEDEDGPKDPDVSNPLEDNAGGSDGRSRRGGSESIYNHHDLIKSAEAGKKDAEKKLRDLLLK